MPYVMAFLVAFAPFWQNTNPGSLACPASIEVSETATPAVPFAASDGHAERKLLSASVLNISGSEEFDLKPDDTLTRGARTVLRWNLDDYRDHQLVLRCSCHDSSVKLTAPIPALLHHCEAMLTIASQNRITGISKVECR